MTIGRAMLAHYIECMEKGKTNGIFEGYLERLGLIRVVAQRVIGPPLYELTEAGRAVLQEDK